LIEQVIILDVMKSSPNLKSKLSKNPSRHRAFTLIELLVSVGIFTMMTALVVAKYGSFNQSVLMTNLAYDVALTIRTAQTYGLSVKNSDTTNSTTQFLHGYGVHFQTGNSADLNLPRLGGNDQIILFADDGSNGSGPFAHTSDNGAYNIESPPLGDTIISTYSIKRGAIVDSICVGSPCVKINTAVALDITFKRPDPNAVICLYFSCNTKYTYAEITVKGTDGSTRTISVRENGQISVKD